VQSSACSAVTAYNLAMADTLLPRYVRPEEPVEAEAPAVADGPAIDASFKVVAAPINGVWDGTFTEQGWTFKLTMAAGEGGTMSGSYSSSGGSGAITKGKWDAESKKASFVYESESYGAMSFGVELRDDGTLSGKIGENMLFTAKRKSDLPKGDSKGE